MVIDPSDIDWPSLDLLSLLAYVRDGIEQARTELERRDAAG